MKAVRCRSCCSAVNVIWNVRSIARQEQVRGKSEETDARQGRPYLEGNKEKQPVGGHYGRNAGRGGWGLSFFDERGNVARHFSGHV